MKPSDVVETTLGTTLSAEQTRLINGFLVMSTPGYVAPIEDAVIPVRSLTSEVTVRAIRRLASQGLKAPAIAIQIDTNLSMVYSLAKANDITLNKTRNRINTDIVDGALGLLRSEGPGVSVIGVAVEMDISPASLIRIIDGDHPVMTRAQKSRAANLESLNYHLIR
jgi:hypothetical protein